MSTMILNTLIIIVNTFFLGFFLGRLIGKYGG